MGRRVILPTIIMKIKHYCSNCDGTGETMTHDPYSLPVSVTCPQCSGDGYTTTDIIGDEFDILNEKLDAMQIVLDQIKIKTKA
jgi:excinuclease UvrABC ATPase subunit